MENFVLKISISSFMSFLVGIFVGVAIFFLIMFYFIISSFKKSSKKNRPNLSPIFKKEIKWIVEDCKNEYKNDNVREEIGAFNHFKVITARMIKDIASKFNVRSRKPQFELTIDEMLLLTRYISRRVDRLFENKILKRFRNMTIKQIIDLKNLEKRIRNSAAVEGAKLSNADKLLKVVQVFNPVFWFRKAVYEPIVNKIILNITLEIIEIIGEESYLIYSKCIFSSKEEIYLSETDEENKARELEEIYRSVLEDKEKK